MVPKVSEVLGLVFGVLPVTEDIDDTIPFVERGTLRHNTLRADDIDNMIDKLIAYTNYT